MYKHFIRTLLINAAAPCRYAQSGAHLEINYPKFKEIIGVKVHYHTQKIQYYASSSRRVLKTLVITIHNNAAHLNTRTNRQHTVREKCVFSGKQGIDF